MARFVLSAFADEAADRLEEQIAALKGQGIGLIELRGVNGVSCADLTEEEALSAAEALRSAGIGFSALGSPYGKYPIDQPFEPHFEAFRRG
ncbi:MAG: sugar phosphate isomerase/epimerase, partial [Clostridia bacterium]|nr:sugar phosphate isomerase/epimerase [Clostridia bacterium]